MAARDVVGFGIKKFDELLEGGIPPGSCILLLSPPMSELRLFCLEYIYKGVSEGIPGLYITLEDSPERLKHKALRYGWGLKKAEDENLLKWVDAYSIHSNEDVEDTEAIRRVSGPLALSDMSIALSGAKELFREKSDVYKIVFDSVSTLLLYNNPETIYRFLEVITAKVKDSDGIGIFTLGEGMHDSKIEMTIRHMMDGTINFDQDFNFEVKNYPIHLKQKNGILDLTKKGFKLKT